MSANFPIDAGFLIPNAMRIAVDQLFRRNLLLVLALVGCFLMTMLVKQQNQTIISQRALIRDLFRDSLELNALKVKALRDAHR